MNAEMEAKLHTADLRQFQNAYATQRYGKRHEVSEPMPIPHDSADAVEEMLKWTVQSS